MKGTHFRHVATWDQESWPFDGTSVPVRAVNELLPYNLTIVVEYDDVGARGKWFHLLRSTDVKEVTEDD